MNVPAYCRCADPDAELLEGVPTCTTCGEVIPDPLLRRVLEEVLRLRAQVQRLDRELTEPKRAAAWLAPKQLAARLGRSVDFVYAHAEELGAQRFSTGKKPRLFFPADGIGRDTAGSGQIAPNGDETGEGSANRRSSPDD